MAWCIEASQGCGDSLGVMRGCNFCNLIRGQVIGSIRHGRRPRRDLRRPGIKKLGVEESPQTWHCSIGRVKIYFVGCCMPLIKINFNLTYLHFLRIGRANVCHTPCFSCYQIMVGRCFPIIFINFWLDFQQIVLVAI